MPGNDQIYLGAPFTNSDSNPTGLNPGDVIQLDLSSDASVRRTTTSNSTSVFGIIVVGGAPNSKVIVASFRGQRLRVNVAAADAVNRGDLLVSSATAGLAKVDNGAIDGSVFAVAVENKASNDGTSVECLFSAVGVGVITSGDSVSTARVLTAGAGLTGGGDLTADRTFNIGANADNSIVVNANDIQVGVITDAQHGNRAGGALHPVATSSTAGFMSAADKAAFDIGGGSVAVVNLTALAAINTTTFPDIGVRRFVTTVRDWYRLDKTVSRTGDSITIIPATTGGGFWVRENIGDPTWGTFAFVSIDPINGNDENVGFGTSLGASDAAPLQTFGELNRRIPEVGFTNDVLCHVINTIPDNQEDDMVLTRLRVQSYDTKFVILGALSSVARPAIFTGTVSSYVAGVAATNTQRKLTISGVPTGLAGKFIQKADGSKSSFLLRDLGSNSYSIKHPVSTNATTGDIGSLTEFVNGESVVIYDLLTAPISPLPATVFTRDVDDTTGNHPSNVVLSNFKLRSATSGSRVELDAGNSSSKLINCILVDPLVLGGENSTWSNVLFTSDVVGLGFFEGINFVSLFSCALLNTQIQIRNCSFDILSSLDIEGNSSQTTFYAFHMLRGTCTITATSCEISVFNSTQGLISSAESACSYISLGTTSLYGSGNSSLAFYNIDLAGTHWALRTANQFATTSATHPITIKGTGYNFTDLPISLMFSQITIDSD